MGVETATVPCCSCSEWCPSLGRGQGNGAQTSFPGFKSLSDEYGTCWALPPQYWKWPEVSLHKPPQGEHVSWASVTSSRSSQAWEVSLHL